MRTIVDTVVARYLIVALEKEVSRAFVVRRAMRSDS